MLRVLRPGLRLRCVCGRLSSEVAMSQLIMTRANIMPALESSKIRWPYSTESLPQMNEALGSGALYIYALLPDLVWRIVFLISFIERGAPRSSRSGRWELKSK